MNSAASIPARNTKVMNRFDLTSRLVAKLKNEEAVIGGIGNTNFDLWAAGHRPQNFYMLGSMGLAFPIALGVALAQPKRRVFALEGDGSLLMQLGSPVDDRDAGAEESHHDRDGQRHLPDHRRAADAGRRGRRPRRRRHRCGLANSAWAADEEDFERLIDQSLSASGPTLIGVRIDDKPGVGTTRRDPVQIRERFMHGLGRAASRCKMLKSVINHTRICMFASAGYRRALFVLSRPMTIISSTVRLVLAAAVTFATLGPAALSAALRPRPERRTRARLRPAGPRLRSRLSRAIGC